MKNLISALLLCFFSVALLAQPAIQWQKLLGGSYGDAANNGQVNIYTFAKGLYLVTATTLSGKTFSGKICKIE